MTFEHPNPCEGLDMSDREFDLAPPDYCDPVIEAYKKDVDRTLLRENLKNLEIVVVVPPEYLQRVDSVR